MKIVFKILILASLLFVVVGCGTDDSDNQSTTNEDGETLTPVKLVLDWTPNTNHTGLYVAKEQGFFEEEGLDVEIMLPGEVGSNQLVASGQADFGVSYQERVIMARPEGLPLVSIAAVIQHNTAGYASPTDKNIQSPKDFEGKKFGGIGVPLQESMMRSIMEQNDADVDKVEFINIGQSDWFTAIERDVDFSTVYYGWTGIEAELRGLDINMMFYTDVSEGFDFYTPVLVTSEEMIENNAETVRKFVHAAAKGYEFAIENPSDAADILIDSVPDLNPDLVKRSQEWLADRYQDDAPQWGIQELERWEMPIDYLYESGITDEKTDPEASFTNEFLPEK